MINTSWSGDVLYRNKEEPNQQIKEFVIFKHMKSPYVKKKLPQLGQFYYPLFPLVKKEECQEFRHVKKMSGGNITWEYRHEIRIKQRLNYSVSKYFITFTFKF